MSKRPRKQRVALRHRRREVIKDKLRSVVRRSVLLAVAGGFVLGVGSKGDVYLDRFLQRYTPQIDVLGPASLTTLPVRSALPAQPLWLWLPWSGRSVEKNILEDYPFIRRVRIERQLSARRIRLRLDPRLPLAQMGDRAIDAEGVVFPLSSGAGAPVPTLALAGRTPLKTVGAWLHSLASNPLLWQKLTSIQEDKDGSMWLTFRSGTEIWWGAPEPLETRPKCALLLKVLEDAQQNLRGAARADLRFFSEGRIIVRTRG